MVTKLNNRINYTLKDQATPRNVAEHHELWRRTETGDIAKAARQAGITYALRQLDALTKLTGGREAIPLENIVDYAVSFSEGYYAALASLAAMLPVTRN